MLWIKKYYWKYTVFKEEFHYITKCVVPIGKKESKNNLNNRDKKYVKGQNVNMYFSSNNIDKKKIDNLVSLSKNLISGIV
jgi:hypothetical protein